MWVAFWRASAIGRFGRWGALLGGLVFGGCSELSEGGDFADPNDWSCLGTAASAATSSMGDAATVQYSVQIASLIGGPPPQNVRIKACNPVDVLCLNPVTETVEGSPDGWFSLRLPIRFAGFMAIEADEMVPVQYYPVTNLTEDTVYPVPFGLPPQAAVVPLAATSGTIYQDSLAHLMLQAHDCEEIRAEGVAFGTNLSGGVRFFFADGLPVEGAEGTGARGIGGFLNMPDRAAEVWIQRAGRSSERIGARTVSLRSGWFTTVDLTPF